MKRTVKGLIALLLTAVIATSLSESAHAITIDVLPSLAPNAYGSPSFAGYQANAIYALQNGLSAYGDPTLPTYYQVRSNVTAQEGIVTGFNSWLGQASPVGAFSAELGNRMTFGVHIYGGQFSISQLSFNATSSDPGNALGFSYVGGYNYSEGYVGLDYGADRIKGTADDVFINSGLNTQLVDELFGRGSGNSLAAYETDPGATLQDKIYDVALDFTDPTTFSATYYLQDGSNIIASGSGEFDIAPVPEPSTFLLFGAGLGAFALVIRRKNRG